MKKELIHAYNKCIFFVRLSCRGKQKIFACFFTTVDVSYKIILLLVINIFVYYIDCQYYCNSQLHLVSMLYIIFSYNYNNVRIIQSCKTPTDSLLLKTKQNKQTKKKLILRLHHHSNRLEVVYVYDQKT